MYLNNSTFLLHQCIYHIMVLLLMQKSLKYPPPYLQRADLVEQYSSVGSRTIVSTKK